MGIDYNAGLKEFKQALQNFENWVNSWFFKR
jgi:hypothetical protein